MLLARGVAGTHIIALGGSLLRAEEKENLERWFSGLKRMVAHLESLGESIGIVVGGGAPAREGISIARSQISDERRLDEVGIAATRLNATIIQQVLSQAGIDVSPDIPRTLPQAAQLLAEHSVVCMGGTVPGHTTDAVAVGLAVISGASVCIIATNVSHVYDSDPMSNPNAQPFDSMTLQGLAHICGVGEPLAAGASAVVDPVAVQRAIDGSLALAVVDGRHIERLEKVILGVDFEGTSINP